MNRYKVAALAVLGFGGATVAQTPNASPRPTLADASSYVSKMDGGRPVDCTASKVKVHFGSGRGEGYCQAVLADLVKQWENPAVFEVPAVPTTDIKGWYIGESLADFLKNPNLGGNADVCSPKPSRNLKLWCENYNRISNGQRGTLDMSPFSFTFLRTKVVEIQVKFDSYETAVGMGTAKFGQPTSTGTGNGDVSSGFGVAVATGRVAEWLRADGASIYVHESIVADDFGVHSKATLHLGTDASLKQLYPESMNKKVPTL